jgi:superfamily II DNA/RNA helicase
MAKGKLFSELGLDSRVSKAVARSTFVRTTEIQEKAIPVVVRGRDVCCRAATGSGKTIAYLVPLVERLLAPRAASASAATTGEPSDAHPLTHSCMFVHRICVFLYVLCVCVCVSGFSLRQWLLIVFHSCTQLLHYYTTLHYTALILVPTHELTQQVADTLQSLLYFCPDYLSVVSISGKASASLVRMHVCIHV